MDGFEIIKEVFNLLTSDKIRSKEGYLIDDNTPLDNLRLVCEAIYIIIRDKIEEGKSIRYGYNYDIGKETYIKIIKVLERNCLINYHMYNKLKSADQSELDNNEIGDICIRVFELYTGKKADLSWYAKDEQIKQDEVLCVNCNARYVIEIESGVLLRDVECLFCKKNYGLISTGEVSENINRIKVNQYREQENKAYKSLFGELIDSIRECEIDRINKAYLKSLVEELRDKGYKLEVKKM